MNDLPILVLASSSPRRAEILTSVGWPYIQRAADIDETPRPYEPPHVYVERLAIEKAEAVARDMPGEIVLGADTTVVIGGEIVGKPTDLTDARRMLRLLSGGWHEVLTGVAIVRGGATSSAVERTRVKFGEMSDQEIDFLAVNGEPLDKAGAYAVQAQAALFIEGIEGDYWNVVGLPIRLVYNLINKNA
ncbi:MAG: Maf family protein [Pyrinomonadaceae bacterium]